MSNIYYGRGTKEHFDDYMDFINYVFGFNGNESDFKKLLPKLYTVEAMPAYYSFNAIKDGKFKAAIGAFPGSLKVCGIELKTCGIGNVAVHPYSRGEGYMKKCLNMAIDDMIANGVDMSSLGGQRQRYNYFSYEKAGINYAVSINKTNMRHAFGAEKTAIKAIEVTKNDKAYIDAIKEMCKKNDFAAYRNEEIFYDILCTWKAKPYVFLDNDEIIGYSIVGGNGISECYAVKPSYIIDFARALLETRDVITFEIPEFKREYVKELEPICDNVNITCNHMFTVLNYKNVIKAFMLLKQTYAKLPDGELKVLIHGRGGDETLLIKVENGIVSVTDTDSYDIELEHLEAMRFFFNHVYIKRGEISEIGAKWFPLPIYEYGADAV